jgi:hypothetical protein
VSDKGAPRGIGERVTVYQPDSNYFLMDGTVVQVREPWQVFANLVRLDRGGEHWFRDDELAAAA